jgi:hypothetical protein
MGDHKVSTVDICISYHTLDIHKYIHTYTYMYIHTFIRTYKRQFNIRFCQFTYIVSTSAVECVCLCVVSVACGGKKCKLKKSSVVCPQESSRGINKGHAYVVVSHWWDSTYRLIQLQVLIVVIMNISLFAHSLFRIRGAAASGRGPGVTAQKCGPTPIELYFAKYI